MNNFKVSDEETKGVIRDFLEMGHADNIIAMFKQDSSLFAWTGELLHDERFVVRLGLVLVFEELAAQRCKGIRLAIPALTPLLAAEIPAYIRGEAVTILGIIGTTEALQVLEPLQNDADPQVREITGDIFAARLKN
ncbi:HEAT repeat domain-containing protein [Desulfobacterota bacterium M19]